MRLNKIEDMETTLKKQVKFRLDSDLLETLRSAAEREHQSLSNFVEALLMEVMYIEPNEETKATIEEARSGKVPQ